MKRSIALLLMLATVGCVDMPLLDSAVDLLVEDEEPRFVLETLIEKEGWFAPEEDQDFEAWQELLENIANDPVNFQDALQSTSWRQYQHRFLFPNQARALFIELEVDFKFLNGEDLDDGPAGTLNLSFHDPNGHEQSSTPYEIIYWSDKDVEVTRGIPLPPIEGEWKITISGSGLDGLGRGAYSGEYHVKVLGEVLVN